LDIWLESFLKLDAFLLNSVCAVSLFETCGFVWLLPPLARWQQTWYN